MSEYAIKNNMTDNEVSLTYREKTMMLEALYQYASHEKEMAGHFDSLELKKSYMEAAEQAEQLYHRLMQEL